MCGIDPGCLQLGGKRGQMSLRGDYDGRGVLLAPPLRGTTHGSHKLTFALVEQDDVGAVVNVGLLAEENMASRGGLVPERWMDTTWPFSAHPVFLKAGRWLEPCARLAWTRKGSSPRAANNAEV